MLKGDYHTIIGNLALQNGMGDNTGNDSEGCSLCVVRHLYSNQLQRLSPLMNSHSTVENNAAWFASGGSKPKKDPWGGGEWLMPDNAINTFR